jgi:hypothetical protein
MIGYLVYLLGVLVLAGLALRGTLKGDSQPEPKRVRVERDRDPRLPRK